MPRTIRFHRDEHCDPAIAQGLRRHAIDVTTTPEAGLIGRTDEEQVAYARSLGRVTITQDRDDLRLHAGGVPHAGIASCHQQARSLGETIDILVLIWEVYGLFRLLSARAVENSFSIEGLEKKGSQKVEPIAVSGRIFLADPREKTHGLRTSNKR